MVGGLFWRVFYFNVVGLFIFNFKNIFEDLKQIRLLAL